MEMPEGWKYINEQLGPTSFMRISSPANWKYNIQLQPIPVYTLRKALDLMKEMAEALDFYKSYFTDRKTLVAENVLDKFSEWK